MLQGKGCTATRGLGMGEVVEAQLVEDGCPLRLPRIKVQVTHEKTPSPSPSDGREKAANFQQARVTANVASVQDHGEKRLLFPRAWWTRSIAGLDVPAKTCDGGEDGSFPHDKCVCFHPHRCGVHCVADVPGSEDRHDTFRALREIELGVHFLNKGFPRVLLILTLGTSLADTIQTGPVKTPAGEDGERDRGPAFSALGGEPYL